MAFHVRLASGALVLTTALVLPACSNDDPSTAASATEAATDGTTAGGTGASGTATATQGGTSPTSASGSGTSASGSGSGSTSGSSTAGATSDSDATGSTSAASTTGAASTATTSSTSGSATTDDASTSTTAATTDASTTGSTTAGSTTTDTTTGGSTGIEIVGSESVYDTNGRDVMVPRPAGSAPGDLLVLFLHRTDSYLPLTVDGWTRVAECYKRDNGYDCSTFADCTVWASNPNFCETFGGNDGARGQDLAQAAFVREVQANEPAAYEFDLNLDPAGSGPPGWAIIVALRGADTVDPVRDWDHRGCDQSPDSVFPSVEGDVGDLLLLSQSFDDTVPENLFLPPDGMQSLGYTSQSDEAGFLFGAMLDAAGPTGERQTNGPGASNCKDALVSLTIQPR
jgi:hypothetical protein